MYICLASGDAICFECMFKCNFVCVREPFSNTKGLYPLTGLSQRRHSMLLKNTGAHMCGWMVCNGATHAICITTMRD